MSDTPQSLRAERRVALDKNGRPYFVIIRDGVAHDAELYGMDFRSQGLPLEEVTLREGE